MLHMKGVTLGKGTCQNLDPLNSKSHTKSEIGVFSAVVPGSFTLPG